MAGFLSLGLGGFVVMCSAMEKVRKQELFLLAGGGSGGHLYPGLAVAYALREKRPGADIEFVVTGREIDKQILQSVPFECYPQPIRPLPRSIGDVIPFYKGWRDSVKLCRRLTEGRRVVTLGLGGFASGPAIHLAKKAGRPAAILNPDAVPGRANRFAIKAADKIFLQWEASKAYFGSAVDRCVVTGCPIRRSLVEGLEAKRTAEHRSGMCVSFDLDPEKKILLVMAGSQGGATVNRTVTKCITEQLEGWSGAWQVLHLTGAADAGWVAEAYRRSAFHAVVWSYSEKMDQILPITDLAVCRAGASTLAELTAVGVPSILLPYPYHKDQHQRKNAEILAEADGAIVVIDDTDADSTADRLKGVLQKCFSSADVLFDMAKNLKTIARSDPAVRIAEALIELAG